MPSRPADVTSGGENGGDGRRTREQLIEAAIETIVERGYYRATSNEIARRAGVSWGVIQYYFKTRENLLLAALDEAIAMNVANLRRAVISGETLAERLVAYGRVLFDYYGSNEYLAHLQIIINLERDPKTAAGTIDAMMSTTTSMGVELSRLLTDTVEPLPLDADERAYVFSVMRGLAVDALLRRTSHPYLSPTEGEVPLFLLLAADGLAAQLAHRHGGSPTGR